MSALVMWPLDPCGPEDDRFICPQHLHGPEEVCRITEAVVQITQQGQRKIAADPVLRVKNIEVLKLHQASLRDALENVHADQGSEVTTYHLSPDPHLAFTGQPSPV